MSRHCNQFTAGIFLCHVTEINSLQWLPCQAPGVIGSVLGLVGLVSVYCDWVRWTVCGLFFFMTELLFLITELFLLITEFLFMTQLSWLMTELLLLMTEVIVLLSCSC